MTQSQLDTIKNYINHLQFQADYTQSLIDHDMLKPIAKKDLKNTIAELNEFVNEIE